MELVLLQGEGGQQPEFVGEVGPGLRVADKLQHQLAPPLGHQGVLLGSGKAMLIGGVVLPLGVDGIVHHLAAVGEQDGRVVAPDPGIRLPHMLHAIALADYGDDLRAPGRNRHLQILVFQNKFHGKSSYYSANTASYFTNAKNASTTTPSTIRYTPNTEKEWART